MPPNASDVADPTRVGDFEAESVEVNAQPQKQGAPKKKKMVNVKALSMTANLPEQGSWHYDRKKAILQKHPEVKSLYGQNQWSFLLMLVAVCTHTVTGIYISQLHWAVVLFLAYTFGTYLSWICMVLGHEGSHGLVFENKSLNKIHTIIAFLPVFLGPFGTFWSIEHMYHHQVVVDKMNRYGPQQAPLVRKLLSALLFISVLSLMFAIASVIAGTRALIHLFLYSLGQKKTPFPTSYAMRPYSNFPQVVNNPWYFVNMAAIFIFNGVLFYHHGIAPIVYFFITNGFCNGLHPLGMRQVQEHYMQTKAQPTNSVYSSLNLLLLNIGFHVEHHDFPAIPWNRLPQLRAMAPEFYNNLFAFESYTQVFTDFITKPGIPYTSLLEDSCDTVPPKPKAH